MPAYHLVTPTSLTQAIESTFRRWSGKALSGPSAVFERKTQRLSLYIDGRLDTLDGKPSAANPADISGIGPSTSISSFCIGGLGVGYPFTGSIDEVSSLKGALKAADLSFAADSVGMAPVPEAYHASGEYISTPSDWGSLVQLTSLKAGTRLVLSNARGKAETPEISYLRLVGVPSGK